MSMRDYAVNDYGLLMTEDMLKIIASKVCDDYSDKNYEDDPWAFNDVLYEKGIVEYISEFTGESIEIMDSGRDNWPLSENWNDDSIWYVPASNCLCLFAKAYENIDEMAQEFKDKIGEYLPDDFDYHEHIRHIVGTYFG